MCECTLVYASSRAKATGSWLANSDLQKLVIYLKRVIVHNNNIHVTIIMACQSSHGKTLNVEKLEMVWGRITSKQMIALKCKHLAQYASVVNQK